MFQQQTLMNFNDSKPFPTRNSCTFFKCTFYYHLIVYLCRCMQIYTIVDLEHALKVNILMDKDFAHSHEFYKWIYLT